MNDFGEFPSVPKPPNLIESGYTPDQHLPNELSSESDLKIGGFKIDYQAVSDPNNRIVNDILLDIGVPRKKCLIYSVKEFNIQNGLSKLGVVKILPPGWELVMPHSGNLMETPPEQLKQIMMTNMLDHDYNRIIIGPLSNEVNHLKTVQEKPEDIVPILLWNVIFANAITQLGHPTNPFGKVNPLAMQLIKNLTLDRRTEILDILKKGKEDPMSIATFPIGE